MSDYLVKLYDIPPCYPLVEKLKEKNIVIRRPIGSEVYLVLDWIREHFSSGWAAQAETAMYLSPKGIFIALREAETEQGIRSEMLGFACYDGTAKGFFGPTGVAEEARHQGIGEALLLSCLHGMKDYGYGYAVIGWVGPSAFYERCCGAVEIPNSSPGVYRGMLRGK